MESAEAWKDLFHRWPESFGRTGIVVTNFGEQVSFSGFMVSAAMLLIERTTPDVAGARKVILPYENISALKIIEVVKNKPLIELGFEGKVIAKRK